MLFDTTQFSRFTVIFHRSVGFFCHHSLFILNQYTWNLYFIQFSQVLCTRVWWHFFFLYQINTNREQKISLYRFALTSWISISIHPFVVYITWYPSFFPCLCCCDPNFPHIFLFFILHDQHPFLFLILSRLLFPFFAINEMDTVLGCSTRSTFTHRNTNKKRKYFLLKKKVDSISLESNRR